MSGQDKFAKVSTFYCKGAGAAILAYDITDSNSFNQLSRLIENIKSSQDNVMLVIIGTKYDLVEENPEMRQVSIQEARELADSLNAAFFETSARTNINVEEVFNNIGNSIFPQSNYNTQGPIEDSPIFLTQSRPLNVRTSQNLCCLIQ
jgi:GTPase SAR1 family protein